jgi:hypothetical protein
MYHTWGNEKCIKIFAGKPLGKSMSTWDVNVTLDLKQMSRDRSMV